MHILPVLALLPCLALAACDRGEQSAPPVASVDVERAMRESAPGQVARKHVTEARAILQKGLEQLTQEWKDAPEAARRKAMSEGLAALNRQMATEEAAANAVVMKLLQEECEKWRATRKAVAVAPRQSLLAVDAGADITAEIIAAMNARAPEFPALPKVQVKKREQRTGK